MYFSFLIFYCWAFEIFLTNDSFMSLYIYFLSFIMLFIVMKTVFIQTVFFSSYAYLTNLIMQRFLLLSFPIHFSVIWISWILWVINFCFASLVIIFGSGFDCTLNTIFETYPYFFILCSYEISFEILYLLCNLIFFFQSSSCSFPLFYL